MKYKRKLHSSEAGWHYIYIDVKHRKHFPPKHEEFTMLVKGQKCLVRLDAQKRIWAGSFSNKINWVIDSIVEITKTPDGIYTLEQYDR